MRIILKIILLPINLVLTVLTLFLTFVLNIGTFILNLVSLFATLGFIAALIEGNKFVAIQAIIIAFLLSPYGIPVIGHVIIEFIKNINEKISDI